MEQLWNYMYMCAKQPVELDPEYLRKLLQKLHQCKVKWMDASLWPEDYTQGQWTRVVPMAFLVANIGTGRPGSIGVIDAICSGELYPHPAASAVINAFT